MVVNVNNGDKEKWFVKKKTLARPWNINELITVGNMTSGRVDGQPCQTFV